MVTNRYFLRRAKKLFFSAYHRYEKKKETLPPPIREEIAKELIALQAAILERQGRKALNLSRTVGKSIQLHLKKSLFEKIRDFTLGIGGALVIAILIRQMWFELYEIPTGSMRPTFKEQDRLSVSKTDFAINIPLKLGHFYFNQKLLKRSDIVIFTVENMDFKDSDTVYFYLFPGKKLLVKRLIGKPGDTLYFYGGKIYGIDSEGKDISPELQLPQLEKIDHIPFISFEGTRVSTTPSTIPGIYSPVVLYQMNEPLARLYALSPLLARGEVLPKILLKNPQIHYGDLWGIKNFAMARLLTKEQVRVLTDQDPSTYEDAPLYLELKHHPSLSNAKIGTDEYNRLRPEVGLSTSLVPLQEPQMRQLMESLYTSRFVVHQGFAHRYGINPERYGTKAFFPHLSDVPDGTYEFYYGKAYQVMWQGICKELPKSHPLYRFDPARLQLLFNLGMEFDNRYAPQAKDQYLTPARYSYFREGDLFVMGEALLKKGEPKLTDFISREERKRKISVNYHPFLDKGPPLLPNGTLNLTFIEKFGLKIPPKSYLVLGDNHAGSGDSRDFGFVPEENLRGGPQFIFWPPGSRFGWPNQPGYALFNPARAVVWTLAAIGFGVWYYFHRKRHTFPFPRE
jgi:signal peptidase I